MRTIEKVGVLFVLLSATLLIVGCGAKYRVTQPLEVPLESQSICVVGEITDALPADFEPEDKPTLDHINMLRRYIEEELNNKEVLQTTTIATSKARYEVTGSILDFGKGSGAARFFIGFGAGSAKLTVELTLKDIQSGEVIFAANFNQTVSSWTESGDESFKRVAKDFAKALEKNAKNLSL